MNSSLTSSDNGGTVDLRVGSDVTLRLSENPTTGYRWAIAAADTNLVEIDEGEYLSTSTTAGGGGEAQWLIKAKKAGLTEISLKYWRPFEGDRSIVERFRVTVRISP